MSQGQDHNLELLSNAAVHLNQNPQPQMQQPQQHHSQQQYQQQPPQLMVPFPQRHDDLMAQNVAGMPVNSMTMNNGLYPIVDDFEAELTAFMQGNVHLGMINEWDR